MDHKVNLRQQSVGGEVVSLELIREKGDLNLKIHVIQVPLRSVLFSFILHNKETSFTLKELLSPQSKWKNLWNTFKDHSASDKGTALSYRDVYSLSSC